MAFVRMVPKLYAALQRAVRQDQRVGLGFMGNRRRAAERLANAEAIAKAIWQERLPGSSPQAPMS